MYLTPEEWAEETVEKKVQGRAYRSDELLDLIVNMCRLHAAACVSEELKNMEVEILRKAKEQKS